MDGWALLFCVMLAGTGLLFWSDHRRRQHEQIYRERMRGSMLYNDEIYPLIAEAQKRQIDRVLVERNRVVIYTVFPPGMLGEYVLTDSGHRPLNEYRTWALTEVIAEDLPALRLSRCYRLKRYRVTRPNGVKDNAYMFIIRSAYKTELLVARQRKPRLY